MRCLFWNIRGFGRKGRRQQLKSFLKRNKIDIIYLQETIRQDFSMSELQNLVGADVFFWSWLPALGHSGGILVGCRDSKLEVGAFAKEEFFVSVSLHHRRSKFNFEFIGVYGPADHGRSAGFLAEFDFNLIRGSDEKNNRNIN